MEEQGAEFVQFEASYNYGTSDVNFIFYREETPKEVDIRLQQDKIMDAHKEKVKRLNYLINKGLSVDHIISRLEQEMK